MYASYVNIFRADRYMAPHVRKQVAHRRVLVAPHLEDLLAQIHGLMQVRS